MKSIMLRPGALALLLAIAVAPARAQTAAPKPSPTPAPTGAVVLRVNGEEIHQSQFDDALNSAAVDKLRSILGNSAPPPGVSPDVIAHMRDSYKTDPQFVEQVEKRLIQVTVYNQAIKKLAPAIKSEAVDGRVKEVNEQLKSANKTVEQRATETGQTMDQIRDSFRRELATEQLLTDQGVTIEPTDDDIHKLFESHKDEITTEALRLSHILIAFPPGGPGQPPGTVAPDAATKAAVKAKAEEVYAKVKAGGDFAALAKQYSEDPGSGPNGGDLGYSARGAMVPAFEAAAWALKKDGDISGLVETNFGFHIIKRTGYRSPRTFDDEKESMRMYLRDNNVETHLEDVVNKLVATAKVEDLLPKPTPGPTAPALTRSSGTQPVAPPPPPATSK